MPKAGKLSAIDLDEISGVDEAANLVRGWVLMKNKDNEGGTMSEELSDEQVQAYLETKYEEAQKLAKDHASLRAALESSESYLVDAPDEVKTAAQTLWSYLKAMEEDTPKKKDEEKKTEKSIFARMFAGLLRTDAPKEEPVAKEAEVEEPPVETVSFDAFLSDVRKLAEKEEA